MWHIFFSRHLRNPKNSNDFPFRMILNDCVCSVCLTKIGLFCVQHIYNQISSVPIGINLYWMCILRAEYHVQPKCALADTLLERIAVERLLAVVYLYIVHVVSLPCVRNTPHTRQFGTQTLRTKEIWHIMKGTTCANQKPKPTPKWQTQQNTILIGSGTDDNISLIFQLKSKLSVATLAQNDYSTQITIKCDDVKLRY